MSSLPLVLLVEDNPITRKLVRFALQHEALELAEAVDAGASLAMIQQRRPDLILQDLLLPDMDGFVLAQRLRDLPATHDVPILAFSGLLSQLDEKRIVGSAFTDFVTKPIEPSKLVRIVRAHLPSAAADAPTALRGGQRRLVLADDDDVQRKLSVFRLTRLGFNVVDVADGQSALEAARTLRPEAIITDAMMPILDGFGLCAAVRQDPALKDVPIILVTSTYVDEADRELGRLAGADRFVIRTPDLREMITALEGVLTQSPGAGPAVVQAPVFERERATRTMVQLERQAAAAASARQQCATLSAELAVLNAISEAITQDKDIDQVLRDILAACCDAGGVSIGALYLTDGPVVRTIVVGGRAGRYREAAESFGRDPERFVSLAADPRAKVLSRTSTTGTDRDWLERSGLESALVVPLQHKERPLGALVMMSEIVDLGIEDRMVFAEAVGHQVSVALTLTRAFEESETAARVAREHSDLLESVFTSISDPILVVDVKGHATTWNEAAAPLVGVAPTEQQDVQYSDWSAGLALLHEDRTTPIASDERPLARALRGENVERLRGFLTYPAKPDGAWVSISARPLRAHDGTIRGAVTVSRDITAERRAQEQLMISDRMASIGLMAAGVGHEINNPLSAVIANLEMAVAEIKSLSGANGPAALGDLPDEVGDAYTAAQRVRQIALDLKMFSGGQADNTPIDVEEVLDSAVRMASNQVQHRATVVKQYGGVPPATGAEGRLGQVFLNLIVNAAQAMSEDQAERNEIRLVTRMDEQGRVVVDVEDNGPGIAPHVMRQLFTPFVTTKPAGIGTGLGLSICERLVAAMGGTIWADSTPDVGTVFHVALQAASGVPVRSAAATDTAVTAPPSPARILVVDDEEMIGLILRRALKAHEVTVQMDAQAALAAIAAGARYDAILCDLMMPAMSGIEFYQTLSAFYPDQAAAMMFLTGGAYTRETAAFLESVPNGQLTKPFDVVKLRAAVNAHVAARRGGGSPGAPA